VYIASCFGGYYSFLDFIQTVVTSAVGRWFHTDTLALSFCFLFHSNIAGIACVFSAPAAPADHFSLILGVVGVIMKRREDLTAVQLFTGFDEAEIDAFLSGVSRKSVPKDHVFFGVGAENSSLFIILSGSVKVERAGTAGYIPLAVLSAGRTFGEMSFMDGSRTTAAITSREATEYYDISREAVDKMLKRKPNLAAKLWRNIALDLKERLKATNEVVDQYVDVNLVLLQDQSFREYYARLS
jgi:hypothetical protein